MIVVRSGWKWYKVENLVTFMGEFNHTIDTKGRIVIPSRFRESFSDRLVVTKGFEGSLNIYPLNRFARIAENLAKLPTTKRDAREYVRLFLSKAIECEIDSQNRINLSAGLIKDAELEKYCVFVGAIDHVELWAAERWEKWFSEHSSSFEEVAESITDLMLNET